MTALLQDAGFWALGSLPPALNPEKDFPNPQEVQKFWAKYLGPRRRDVLSGGEVRPPQQVWIVGYSNKLARAAGIPDTIEKYSSRVWHYPSRLALGLRYANRHMTKDQVPRIGFAQWAIEDRKAFDAQNYDGTEFTFGLASPVAYRMFSGAMFTDTYYIAARILEELWELYESPDFGREKFETTNWQWEIPFEMVTDAWLPEPMGVRERRFRKRLKPIEWIMQKAPPGMLTAVHPCPGDLGGWPAVPPSLQKIGTNIAAVNAFGDMEVWDKHRLVNAHMPCGDGLHAPPRLTAEDFRLFEKLRLHPGTTFALGSLSSHLTEEQLPGMVEDASDVIQIVSGKGVEQFRFTTHCGLGRKSVREAVKILQQHNTVRQELTAA